MRDYYLREPMKKKQNNGGKGTEGGLSCGTESQKMGINIINSITILINHRYYFLHCIFH